MSEEVNGTEQESGGDEARAKRVLTDISSRSWEHPADRAALQALRKIPIFDEVLRSMFGFFGEKPIRLAFQASAVRVSEKQFPRIHSLYQEVNKTLDPEREYPLLISQTPIVNAGAYGMDDPFIILNSGTVVLLTDEELAYILGHELGHIMSDHVLYRTMTVLLIQLAGMGFPVVGLAARAVLVALLEWYRKSELSSDRAGLLSIQDPEVAMMAMLKMAGGIPNGTTWQKEYNLNEFIDQAEEYRTGGDVADQVYKVLNLMASTHPYWTLRLSEIRAWIENGDYDRILRGEYARRGDPDSAYKDDLSAAAKAYSEGAKGMMDTMGDAAKRMSESIMGGFKK
jgi:Zn-dependent protease with chaperone function